jgi:hypothetical protein
MGNGLLKDSTGAMRSLVRTLLARVVGHDVVEKRKPLITLAD